MDRTTKALLAIIALGLWANLLLPFANSREVVAGGFDVDSMARAASLTRIESDLSSIASGTCRNDKIC